MTKQHTDRNERVFYRLAFISLITVYFLIVVGGVVRSTGSGMGCPDWPKCFGNWVPPTDESQLPSDYKEVYREKREQKNIRLASYLDALGMESKAKQIREEESIKEEQDFNKYKTWTEYVNRLVGATFGVLVIITFFGSLKFYKSNRSWVWISFALVLLTGFQGWIGSLVVSTNLLPWMITVHMQLTFVIIAGLIYLVYKSKRTIKTKLGNSSATSFLLWACIVTLLVQVLYGTQVREGIDAIAFRLHYQMRDTWIDQLDWQFYFHRSFSWVILGLHVWLLLRAFRIGEKFWSTALLAVILISILTGVILNYLSIPAVIQPVHLLFGCIAFGIQFYLLLIMKGSRKNEVVI